MIPYIENKPYDTEKIQAYLEISRAENQWTNFGPLSRLLEQRLKDIVGVGDSILACSSGTTALWAAMLYMEERAKKKLKWCMSSFSFPCVPRSLFDVDAVDCDDNGMIDATLTSGYEGVIVTNLFGSFNIAPYHDLLKDKVLLFDSAMNLNSQSHRLFEMISFHHTKPWGFGEAGCLIIPEEDKRAFMSIVNFGKVVDQSGYKHYSMNGKISELACAGVLQRLDTLDCYMPIYQSQYHRIANIAKELEFQVIGDNSQGVPCNVPLKFHRPIPDITNDLIRLGRYYEPIHNTPKATNLYQRIINFPCHPGVILEDSEIKSLLVGLTRRK